MRNVCFSVNEGRWLEWSWFGSLQTWNGQLESRLRGIGITARSKPMSDRKPPRRYGYLTGWMNDRATFRLRGEAVDNSRAGVARHVTEALKQL